MCHSKQGFAVVIHACAQVRADCVRRELLKDDYAHLGLPCLRLAFCIKTDTRAPFLVSLMFQETIIERVQLEVPFFLPTKPEVAASCYGSFT